jgi:signal transduction histidine kinase/ActR/RegA family two-component response regulator
VARSKVHEENVGGRLSPSVDAVVARGGAEGFGVARSLEGDSIYAPYSHVQPHEWTAVLGIPTALFTVATYRLLGVYGGAVLLSIALGAAAASWIARGINRPMARLRAAAQALGRRESLAPQRTSIQEIAEVGSALASAAQELAHGEAQREDLLHSERRAREAAESADRAKDEFLAVLSHELRTPLNAVYGWARMLQAGQLRDEALSARAMDAIVRNTDVQVQLIDDLLDLSRITSGKMRLDLQAVDVEAVVQAALDAVRPAAEAKEIRIETAPERRTAPVTGDSARLQQVMWNLLMNAVKFTPKGGRVQVLLGRGDSHVEIVVSDTGQGIAPEMLPYVFERFRQADSSSTRTHGGLGLGLTLVKHLVELHGGTVAASSAGLGQGATFVVCLPISTARVAATGASGPAAVPPAADSLPGVVRLDGLRVLAVDNDREAVALVQAILAGAGAEVRTASSAGEAFEALRRWRPDVLVSDIEMPIEDGYTLIRKVRALPTDEGGRTPAVALTAYGRAQDRLRSLAAGYTIHLAKPVEPAELTAILASACGRPYAHGRPRELADS